MGTSDLESKISDEQDGEVTALKVVDISLVKDGENVNFDGSVDVTIEIDVADCDEVFAFYKNGDSIEYLPATKVDGGVQFTTTHFSEYGVGGITIMPYTVTFDSQGGSEVADVQASTEGYVTKPTDPTKEGFVFAGWFIDDTYSAEFDFDNDTVVSDYTLYARWRGLIEVTFDSNGGTAGDTQYLSENDLVTEPTTVHKLGYTLTKWVTDDETEWNFDTDRVTSSITLHARWANSVCVVTFDSLGGSEVPSQNVAYGESVVLPTNPTKEGYKFMNWNYSVGSLNSGKPYTGQPITTDTTLTAVWYTVTSGRAVITFDSNGGSHVASVEKVIGKKYGTLPTPTKEGSIFKGWYDSTDTKWNSTTIVNENTLLTARWNDTLIVTFDANGGEFNSYPGNREWFEVNSGDCISETVVSAFRDNGSGATFNGWYSDAKCTTLFDFSTPITENIILYAGWTTTTPIHSVTYHFKGDNFSLDPLQIYFTASDTGNVTSTNIAYNSLGVDTRVTDSNSITLQVEDNALLTEPSLHLYNTGWNTLTYFHEYYIEGLYSDASYTTEWDYSTPITSDVDLYVKISVNYLVKVNLHVMKISDIQTRTLSNYSNPEYGAAVTYVNLNDYTIKCREEAGTTPTPDQFTIDLLDYINEEGQHINSYSIPENSKFLGVYFDSNLQHRVTNSASVIDKIYNYNTDADSMYVDLYLGYLGTATVNYWSDRWQSNKLKTELIELGSRATLLKPPAVNHNTVTDYDDYKETTTFTGWYDINTNNAYDIATSIINSNYLNLYANYETTYQYKVIFNTDGGTSIATQYIAKDSLITEPTVTKTNNTLERWEVEGYTGSPYYYDGDTWNFATDVVKAPITLKAIWTPSAFTVTFDSDGGSAVASQTVANGGKATRPSDPTKEHKTFNRWVNADTYADWDFDNDTVTSDTTLKAIWDDKTLYSVTFNTDGGSDVPYQLIYDGDKVQKPENPTKEHYSFVKWVKMSDNSDWDFVNDTVTEHMTLLAVWSATTYTVTFDSDGGSAVANQSIAYGEKVVKPTNPTKPNKEFVKWVNAADNSDWDFDNNVVSETTTLKAIWNDQYVTVDYHLFVVDETGLATPYGMILQELVETRQYVAGAPITPLTVSDFGLDTSHYILLNDDGVWHNGTTCPQPSGLITIPKTYPVTGDGYYAARFNQNWRTKFEEGLAYNGDTHYSVRAAVQVEILTVTYDFYNPAFEMTRAEIESYNYGYSSLVRYVEYDNGNNNGSYMTGLSYTEYWKARDYKGQASNFGIIRPGYTSSEFNTKSFWDLSVGSASEWESMKFTQNTTVMTNRGPAPYTVYFRSQKTPSGITTVAPSQTVYVNQPLTTYPQPTKEGYTFAGWWYATYDTASQTVTSYDTEITATTPVITTAQAANKTDLSIYLYAKWNEIPTYTVTFDSDGGSAVASQTINENEKATQPTNPTKDGYTFSKWVNKADNSDWNFNTPITGDVVLKAIWSENPANTYTVNFDSRGGSVVASQTIAEGGKVTKPADPTKDGYTFVKWRKNSVWGLEWKFDTDTVTTDTTLVAEWTIKTYDVILNANGGQFSTGTTLTKNVAHGNKLNKIGLDTPTRDGYTFEGWFTDASCTTAYDFDTVVTNGFTLYADWKVAKHYVTFNSNGGSAVAYQIVEHGNKATKPADPTRDGYIFKGWFTVANAEFDFNTAITSNVILYAKWTAKPITTYTVTFDSNGGNQISSQTVREGAKAIRPANPIRLGYTFSGWYTSDGQEFNFNTVITSNITLTAKWNENSKPTPVTPTPVIPTPVTPTPVTPTPVIPTPITPVPVTPTPVIPKPITPIPTTPEPTEPVPYEPNDPEPSEPFIRVLDKELPIITSEEFETEENLEHKHYTFVETHEMGYKVMDDDRIVKDLYKLLSKRTQDDKTIYKFKRTF